jgi:glycosyltransferase involved in cell wall biosynthesis
MNRRPRLIAYTHGRDDPAARFRIVQFIPHFERAGWDVSHRPNRPERPWSSPYRVPPLRWADQRIRIGLRRLRREWDIHAASSHDVAFVSRDLLGGRLRFEAALRARNPHVIFDLDDAIHLGAKEAHVAWACAHAAWVTAGNDLLADVARRYTDRVSVLPTVVDTDAYALAGHARTGAPLRVGWLGSDRSIGSTLLPFLDTLAALQRVLGFEFVVVTAPRPPIGRTDLRWRHVAWSPAVETRIADHVDVGIMPLADGAFERGKCGCKLLQYMAAGLPAIASPVGINTRLLAGGRGFLADGERAWADALRALADPGLRRTLGAAGRAFVEREYSLRAWFPRLLRIVEGVRAGTRPGVGACPPA